MSLAIEMDRWLFSARKIDLALNQRLSTSDDEREGNAVFEQPLSAVADDEAMAGGVQTRPYVIRIAFAIHHMD